MSELVALSLGSNVGDRVGNLRRAIEELASFLRIEKVSAFYVSRAILYEAQDDFINVVVLGRTDLEPLEFLDRTQTVERDLWRIYRFRYGPREIDIDIVFFGDRLIDSERLTIPHIGAASRDFVLEPLAEIAADLIHPSLDRTVGQLLLDIPGSDRTVIQRYDG